MSHRQIILLVLALAVLAIGFGAPNFQMAVLDASSGLGTGVLWITIMGASVILATGCVGLGVLRSRGQLIGILSLAWGSLSFLFILFVAFLMLDTAWRAYIGPIATIVVPDDFKGHLTIRLDEMIEPSMATAGVNFVYEIPATGIVTRDRGWIGLRFQLDEGRTILGGKYYTTLVRRNGNALEYKEFDCQWLPRPARGITCEIGESEDQ